MPDILITGGAGNIGASLANRLSQHPNNRIVIADNLLTGSFDKIRPATNVQCIRCDVNLPDQLSAIFQQHRFDQVFHFAAVVGVKRTLDNPFMVLQDIEGIKNVLNNCKNTGVSRVYYSSSSEVYGEPVETPQHEQTTPLNSRLPYAIVKNAGEAFIKTYQKEFGLNYTILRLFNTYGPLQNDDFVITRFLKAASEHKDIVIHGNGQQTRTFCYIDDTIDVVEKIMSTGVAENDTLNVGSDFEITILDLARLILDMVPGSSKIIHGPPLEEGDMLRRKPELSKMKAILNRDLTPLRAGISETFRQMMFMQAAGSKAKNGHLEQRSDHIVR